MEFARLKKRIFVNQRKYVLDLLLGCRVAETTIDPNLKLLKDKERYQRLVGRLIYLSHTHFDIVYVVSMASQFMHAQDRLILKLLIEFCGI